MSPEEARIIRDVFERVRTFGPVRDDDARAAVEAELRANPDAAVGLVQAVVALDRERMELAQRVADLEAAQSQGQGQPSGGLFGGGPWAGRRDDAQAGRTGWPQPEQRGADWNQRDPRWGQQQQPQQPAPWGGQQPQQPQAPWGGQPQAPAPAQAQQRGGGIFSTILGAATGLAAGYVGYEAMKGLFGGNSGAQAGGGGGNFGDLFSGNDSGSAQGGGDSPFEERQRTAADDDSFFNSDSGGFDIGGGGGGDDDSFA
jgi:hypothetical protein